MKKIKNLVLIAALLMTSKSDAQAQNDDGLADTAKRNRTGYLIIGVGVGIPIGKFHSTDWTSGFLNNSVKAGFANSGFSGLIEFTIPIDHSNFGFAAGTSYYNNPINSAALTNAYDVYTGTRNYVTVAGSSYTTNTFLAGLYFTLPAGKLTFDFNALAGIAFCYYPAVTTSMVYPAPGQLNSNTSKAPATTSFTYGGNFTVRYSIKKHFCAFAQGGFFAAKQNYSMIETVFNRQPVVQSNPETIINISAGIGYQF